MSIKNYFSGRSGRFFWLNILAMVVVVVGSVMLAFGLLGAFTHNGEKIEVPSVVGSSVDVAARKLENADLRYVIADSTYNTKMAAGAVIEQTPQAGSMVKGGRIVYLVINMRGEPLVKFPDIVNNSSLREAEAQLTVLGFSLTPPVRVENQPKDFVVGVKQGVRDLHAGQMVSRDRALTIYVGQGEIDSTEVEEIYETDEEVGAELDF